MTNDMGRTRIYENAAARAAAYRERKRVANVGLQKLLVNQRLLDHIRAEVHRAAQGTRSQVALSAMLNRLLELLG